MPLLVYMGSNVPIQFFFNQLLCKEKFRCYEVKIEESENAGLITSKFLFIPVWSKSSKQFLCKNFKTYLYHCTYFVVHFFTTVPPAPTLAHITTVYNNSELIRITSQINITVQKALGYIQVIVTLQLYLHKLCPLHNLF